MLNSNKAPRRALSIGVMACGLAVLIFCLVLAFTGSTLSFRGPLLVVGAIAFFVGLYLYPTVYHHRTIVNIIFLFPLLFTFVITVILPFALGIFYSLTDWTGIRYTEFVGLQNYITMFKSKDFIYSIVLTVLFVVVNMILVNFVAFCLALLCTSKIKGVSFFRAAFFLPNLIGGIVLGYVWQFVFNKVFLTLFNTSFSILADANGAFIAIIAVYVWQYAGYIMMIYITGLQQVPRDVLEASAIDGANPLRTLFAIKIPMIASTFTICTFLTLTSAFTQFDVNLSLTGGTPARMMGSQIYSNGTEMLALNIYKTAVSKSDYATGQAKAVLFFIMLAAVSLIQVRISNKREVEM